MFNSFYNVTLELLFLHNMLSEQNLLFIVVALYQLELTNYFALDMGAEYCDDGVCLLFLSTSISLELHIRSSPYFYKGYLIT